MNQAQAFTSKPSLTRKQARLDGFTVSVFPYSSITTLSASPNQASPTTQASVCSALAQTHINTLGRKKIIVRSVGNVTWGLLSFLFDSTTNLGRPPTNTMSIWRSHEKIRRFWDKAGDMRGLLLAFVKGVVRAVDSQIEYTRLSAAKIRFRVGGP